MARLVPDVGEAKMLEVIINKTSPENLVLRLFTSNTTPAEGDTAVTYTEATGNGYAALTLTGADWTVATNAGTTEAVGAQQTFTFTGALGNVYGYYLTQATSGVLMWAERFADGPYNIVNNGDQIKVTPKLQLA